MRFLGTKLASDYVSDAVEGQDGPKIGLGRYLLGDLPDWIEVVLRKKVGISKFKITGDLNMGFNLIVGFNWKEQRGRNQTIVRMNRIRRLFN